ncbi:hypothetical protein Tco_0178422 [Tanacetum coccineum]
MSTPVFVDPESSTQADGAQSSRVPTPFLEDPYETIRQDCLVETDTESKPFEDPIDTETPESPHAIESPTLLPDSTPLACHTEESEDFDTSGVRSTSSDSTAPLSPDHPLTPHSARVAEAMALSDSALRERYRSSYETSSLSSSSALPVRKSLDDEGHVLDDEGHGLDDKGHGLDDEGHGLDNEGCSVKSDGLGLEGENEVVPEGQQLVVPVVGATASAPLGIGYGALRRREFAVKEDQVYNTFEIGQCSGSVPDPERPERVSTLRQPTLTTWIDPEDGIAYIDIPAYPHHPLRHRHHPSGRLDHTQRLDAMPPTLFVGIDRDVRELYTRSGVVKDEIFSQKYRFWSLELEQERTAMTFRALWRPVLVLEARAGHVDTRMVDMLRAWYDDHRLVHDMLVQHATLQRELQEMRGHVTALEQERDRREQLMI